ETLGSAGVLEDLVAFLDVGEAVVEQGEHVGSDLFTEAVAGAEVLVDPDLHRGASPRSGWCVVRVSLSACRVSPTSASPTRLRPPMYLVNLSSRRRVNFRPAKCPGNKRTRV